MHDPAPSRAWSAATSALLRSSAEHIAEQIVTAPDDPFGTNVIHHVRLDRLRREMLTVALDLDTYPGQAH